MFANWTRPPFRTHHGDRKGVLRMLSAPCTRTHGRRQDRKRKVENEKRKAAAGCECQHGGGKSGRGRSVRGTLRGASGKLHPTSFSQKPHGPSRGMFGMWGMLGMRGMFPAPSWVQQSGHTIYCHKKNIKVLTHLRRSGPSPLSEVGYASAYQERQVDSWCAEAHGCP